MPKKSNSNPDRKEVKIMVGPRPVLLCMTQRFQYRASKTINFEDLQDTQRAFAAACDLVVCLDTNPKPQYTGEDVAIAFEGKEEDLIRSVFEALGIKVSEDAELTEPTPDAEKKD